jgi:hypothetical protein
MSEFVAEATLLQYYTIIFYLMRCSSLNHPNIVRFIGIFTDKDDRKFYKIHVLGNRIDDRRKFDWIPTSKKKPDSLIRIDQHVRKIEYF